MLSARSHVSDRGAQISELISYWRHRDKLVKKEQRWKTAPGGRRRQVHVMEHLGVDMWEWPWKSLQRQWLLIQETQLLEEQEKGLSRPVVIISSNNSWCGDMWKRNCGNSVLPELIAIMSYNIVNYSRGLIINSLEYCPPQSKVPRAFSVQGLCIMNSGSEWSLCHRIALGAAKGLF